MHLFSRYTMVTGQTAMEGFRRHIHPAYAMGLIVALGIIILAALIGLLSIVGDVLAQWARVSFGWEVHPGIWAIGISAVLYAMLWGGTVGSFERILAVLVGVMGVSFVASAIVSFPGWGEVLAGLVPSVPAVAEGSDNSSFVITASMFGTTVSVFVFLIRSGLVQEKRWGDKDFATARRDAAVSATLMFVLSSAVLIAAAGAIHGTNYKFNNIAELIPVLEPVYGKAAMGVFVVGIVAAGISSHLPNLLVIPWLAQDYRGVPRITTTIGNRVVLLILSLLAVAGVLTGVRPVFLMLLSQASIVVVLPLTLAGMIYLMSRESLMGAHRTRGHEFLVQSVVMVLSLCMSAVAVRGLITDITTR